MDGVINRWFRVCMQYDRVDLLSRKEVPWAVGYTAVPVYGAG